MLLLLLSSLYARGLADCVVISNQRSKPVSFRVITQESGVTQLRMEPGASKAVYSDQAIAIENGNDSQLLNSNSLYYLPADIALGNRLRRIEFGEGTLPLAKRTWSKPLNRSDWTIPVLLCADDEEPTRESVWQDRLGKRLVKASEVLERHVGVRLKVVGYKKWISPNQATSFADSLAEFEQQVNPEPGVLAIGFTSQFHLVRHRRHMGGTRGPLRRHILLREWSTQITEAERLGFLLHELGHYLGAGHSAEAQSVMLPVLRPSRLKSDATHYDAANTLLMATLAEERARRGATNIRRCSKPAIERLAQVYSALHRSVPHDPGNDILQQRFSAALHSSEAKQRFTTRLINLNLLSTKGQSDRLLGDLQTNHLVRTVASALPEEPVRAEREDFLILLGLAFDDTGRLAMHPKIEPDAARLDPAEGRPARLKYLQQTTIRGRLDVAQHFFASAALVAAASKEEALFWGNLKEMTDAQGGSGFSFVDMAANRAGVRFAERVLNGSLPIQGLANRFDARHFVPSMHDLPEKLQNKEFIERFGSPSDKRYEAVINEIDKRIAKLPPYLQIGFE